jgi:hypothetical protein
MLTVTADAKSKVYGDVDPALTYQITSGALIGTDALSGALTRNVGEDIGTYAINQGTLALNGNYTLNYVGAILNITARPATVTPDAKSKVYGDADPTFTGTLSGFLPADLVTATYSRTAGETVSGSPYTISAVLSPSGVLGNYNITYNTAAFTITQKTASVAPNVATKVYGDADPTFTGTLSGFLPADLVTATYSRTAGETVSGSPYTISAVLSPSGVLGNYNITYNTAAFTITARPVTVTADAITKLYGDIDPTLTYQITSGNLAFSDAFGGALTRDAGENVGTYAIRQGTLALNGNYTLTYAGADLIITSRLITVTADAKTKVFGQSDPALTYRITSGNLAGNGDAFSGALTRDAGENIGTYAITQGTLALNGNYTLTYEGANLNITAWPITITADAKSKVYGDADPALTYRITSGALVGTDAFTGSLTRDAGEALGTYAITQGTLALNSNYTLTYVGANLTINQRFVTVTADAVTKVYGDADLLTYQITYGTLSGTDNFTGALTRDAGENVGAYTITQGTLALSGNYVLTFVGAELTITARPITVTADAMTKVYGESDPTLTFRITSGSLAFSDVFSGAMTRDAGENVGSYAISQGDLALSSNYILTFAGGNLTITARPVTVTADAKTKEYGASDPILTYQITSGNLAGNGDAFGGALTRDAGENVGTYAITQGTLALTSNYTLKYVGANLIIDKSIVAIIVTADSKSKVYGDADPPLTYKITTGTLVGTDTFTGALTREEGEDVGTYLITQGTLKLSDNYTLAFEGATLTITARPITVTAVARQKVYGESDPELTYEITDGNLASNGDAFDGELTREVGEGVDIYAITQGTLSLSSNYVLTFKGADFTITSKFEMNAYPNPFTDRVYFELELNDDANVRIEIFNLSGIKIATAFSENVQADFYRIEYVPEHVSSGLLIYKLIIDGDVILTGKLIHK